MLLILTKCIFQYYFLCIENIYLRFLQDTTRGYMVSFYKLRIDLNTALTA